MEWKKCSLLKKEFSKLTYIVDDKKYITKHTFKIFNLMRLEQIAHKIGFKKFEAFEQYDSEKPANIKSKNIQIVLS